VSVYTLRYEQRPWSLNVERQGNRWNWRKGYKFGPVQRFRCCDHTTPYHYPTCEVGR